MVLGAEVNFKVAGKGAKIGFDKTIGYSNKGGHYTSTNIGSEVKVDSYSGGLNLNVRNYDNGNLMAMPWEVWNDKNTVIDNTVVLKKNNATSEASTKSHFIGVDFGLFVFAGGRIKIGFNIGG